jgi:two-component system, response regulator PdtaR
MTNKIKILIVEDQLIIARDIESLLIDWGYNVVGIAASSEEALAIFSTKKPDIALVDVHIQGEVDGIETVRLFNLKRPIPIVYLTAQADIQTVDRAKESNPFAYLLKPFDERGLQISLELAFDLFSRQYVSQSDEVPPQYLAEKLDEVQAQPMAHEVKLSADVILQNNNSIFIKQNYRFVKLKKDELTYIEADRNHSFLQTKQHRHIVRMPLAMVLERLNMVEIIRVHRSFAVNIQNVEEFSETEIVVNGKSIPFTVSYREEFLRNFNVI